MYTLATGNTIAGVASAANGITVTISGMEFSAGVEVYKVLYQGQLGISAATLYTAPGSTTSFIRSISVVNTDTVNAGTYQFFINGTAQANAITPVMTIGASSSTGYEDGTGWANQPPASVGTTLTSPTFTTSDIHTGYSDYQAITNPAVPGADVLRIYGRKVAGRMVPKWTPPSGLDTPVQAALWGNNIIYYMPNTGTTAPLNTGTPWATSVTIAHPAPTAGIWNQVKRTTSTMVATTTNQALGASSIVPTAASFWRGNAAGLGGFFFFARFSIETLTTGNNTVRFFVGLQSGTTNILISDTIPAISCIGLWHDTSDGADVIKLLTKDGTTANKGTLDSSPTTPFSTGQAYDFYLFAKPNDSVIYYRLDNFNTGATLSDSSTSTNIPLNSVFMGPNVGMSNGAANTTVGQVGIGINRIYVESDH